MPGTPARLLQPDPCPGAGAWPTIGITTHLPGVMVGLKPSEEEPPGSPAPSEGMGSDVFNGDLGMKVTQELLRAPPYNPSPPQWYRQDPTLPILPEING